MTEPLPGPSDLEEYAGEELPAPWDEPEQTDWQTYPDRSGSRAANWTVVPSLQHLLAELNALAPNRDKTHDGSVGDTSHSARPSGHNPDETGRPEDFDADSINEVRARDFDKNLNQPGLTMEMIVQYLVQGCREGRITWIKYIIYNRRIWAASAGWVTLAYHGPSPHDVHMHVSAKPDTASEKDTRPLGLQSLLEDDVTKSEFLSWMTEWAKSPTGQGTIGLAVMGYNPGRQPDGYTGPAIPDPTAPKFDKKNPKTYGPKVGTWNLGSALWRVIQRLEQEHAETPPTAKQNAAAVIAALAAGPKATATALRELLGEDEAEDVGRLLLQKA